MTETITLSHHVAGKSVAGPAAFEQPNPADPNDLVVEGPEGNASLAGEAVTAARSAVTALADAGVEKRADALSFIGRALMAKVPELALLIARETGKTVPDAKGEIIRAARLFEFFAGEAIRNVGEIFDSTRPGAIVEVTYDPLGVVAAVTPWNFPIAIPAWKIAPAIAFGNSVVWKPSEYSSATAAALMEVMAQSGLPAGAVNMILGAGGAGQAVTSAEGVDAVSFTGSAATGKKVRMAAAEAGKRMQLEMGGVNALVIAADADIPSSVENALNGAFFAAGQRCTATSRIIVDDSIADAFVEALKARMAAVVVGDPRDAKTQVGPLVSLRQKAAIRALTEKVEAVSKPVFGGASVEMPNAFFALTLFDGLSGDHVFGAEEIFGPVAGIYRAKGFEEALALVNANKANLSAGICTKSLKLAQAFKRKAHAGVVTVNLPTAGIDYHAPFGGVGAASYGPREQGRAARHFYTELKTTYLSPGV
jgi:aldehyde dehydrogenase (NAD+)